MSQSLGRQALAVIINRWGSKAINFVTFIILARALTTVEFGIYGLFTSAIFVVEAAGNLGLRQASAHQIGQKTMTDGQALGASFIAWPFAAVACAIVVVQSMSGSVPQATQWAWLWPALVASGGVVLASLCQGVFLGRGEIRNFNFVELTPRILLLLGTLPFLLLQNLNIWQASWVFSLAFALTAIVAAWRARPVQGRLQPSLRALGRLVRQGWPFALTLFLIMLNTRVSLLVLSAKLDTAAAGQFFAALRLNDLILDIAAAVGLVLFSHGARSKDAGLAIRQAAQVTRWLVWAAALVGIVGFIAAPFAIPFLLGANYAASAPAMQCLLLALPMSVLVKVIYPTLAGLGRPLLGAAVLAPAVAVNAGVSLLLADLWGVVGAAVALGLSQTLIGITFVVITSRLYNVSPRSFILPRSSEFSAIVSRLRRRKIVAPNSQDLSN